MSQESQLSELQIAWLQSRKISGNLPWDEWRQELSSLPQRVEILGQKEAMFGNRCVLGWITGVLLIISLGICYFLFHRPWMWKAAVGILIFTLISWIVMQLRGYWLIQRYPLNEIENNWDFAANRIPSKQVFPNSSFYYIFQIVRIIQSMVNDGHKELLQFLVVVFQDLPPETKVSLEYNPFLRFPYCYNGADSLPTSPWLKVGFPLPDGTTFSFSISDKRSEKNGTFRIISQRTNRRQTKTKTKVTKRPYVWQISKRTFRLVIQSSGKKYQLRPSPKPPKAYRVTTKGTPKITVDVQRTVVYTPPNESRMDLPPAPYDQLSKANQHFPKPEVMLVVQAQRAHRYLKTK
jgi:hypothetical protein